MTALVLVAVIAIFLGWRLVRAGGSKGGGRTNEAHPVALPHHALDAVPLGVVVGDHLGRAIYRNLTADALVDSWDDGVVGRFITDGLVALANGEEAFKEQVRTPGPPIRTFEVTARPLFVEGIAAGASVVFTDVTDQLRQDSIRRDFIANVSHELKTPIGALSLLAETLVGESDPEIVNRLANRIEVESQRLATIVEDLIDLSRIEVEAFEIRDRIELMELVGDVIERVRPLADRRGVSIELSVSDGTIIFGNRTQLISMMRNLLENAVEYSEIESQVVLQVRTDREEVVIEVSDRGVGIPERDLQRVFERFYRVDRARSQESGGSGLGLSIVRNVVDRHSGSVELVSTEGLGTTVTVCLPLTEVGVNR